MFEQSRLRKDVAWNQRRSTEQDRSDILSEQEQRTALEEMEAERVHRASIKMRGRRTFPTLRSEANESGAASGRRTPRSFGRGNDLAQVEAAGQRRSDGGTDFRNRRGNRRGTDEGRALREGREGQPHLRLRQGGGQGRRESRREREQRRKGEEEQDEMDGTADAEFERLDGLFEKMMLSEFEQLQDALIGGPREQVYERLDQRKFEQNVLEPTPTIARELSNSPDAAVTASLLGQPSRIAPVRASPAAHRVNLARQQLRLDQQGDYGRWLPKNVQSLGGTDFAKLSGMAPVIGLQCLLAKKPEIGLEYREAIDTKIVKFLKRKAPELTERSIDPAKHQQQPAVSPCRIILSFTHL